MQSDPVLLDRAKVMRREMTVPERKLWHALRAKRFANTKFSEQVIIDRHVADFAARSHKLVIEVDGDTHIDAARDAQRTIALETKGYRVLRFTNADVMHNLEGVLTAIGEALAAPLSQPSPQRGEG